MTKLGRYILILFLIIVLIAGYFGVQSMVNSKKKSEQVSQTISEQIASTTDNQVVDMTYVDNIPTSTTTTPSSWQVHDYKNLNFSIAYPNNVVAREANNSVVISFPVDTYFHWPLQDEARITVSASSTCTELSAPPSNTMATTSFALNGYSFEAVEGNDAAAGNLYKEVVYMTQGVDMCYSLSFFDHSANGAGLYVDDQSLIKKYDEQHDKDLSQIRSIFNSITNSFRIDN